MSIKFKKEAYCFNEACIITPVLLCLLKVRRLKRQFVFLESKVNSLKVSGSPVV